MNFTYKKEATFMTHAHMTAWFLALVLFLVAFFLQKGGKEKGAKIVKMILRVVYLLIIATGLMLLFKYDNLGSELGLKYILKVILGIGIIGLLEMILAKMGKRKPTGAFWIALVVVFAATLYLGFNLPM
jgi:uncharacterized membrane protein SirB2